MNQLAPSPIPSQEEIYRLANSALCGDISEAESQRLEQLVANDPMARRWYVEFICDACNIRAVSVRPHAGRTSSASWDFPVRPVSQPAPSPPSPQTVPHPWFPRQHLPRHGRLFLLGLAGGVSGGNGDFRDRALDRLPGACVPACTGRQAIVSAQPGGCRAEDGACWQDYRHGRLQVG